MEAYDRLLRIVHEVNGIVSAFKSEKYLSDVDSLLVIWLILIMSFLRMMRKIPFNHKRETLYLVVHLMDGDSAFQLLLSFMLPNLEQVLLICKKLCGDLII